MNTYFIKKYIKNISKNDIYNLALKQNIILNNNEIEKIYNYIQKNYKKYFNNILTKEQIITDSKTILTNNNYNKLLNIYSKYKDKI